MTKRKRRTSKDKKKTNSKKYIILTTLILLLSIIIAGLSFYLYRLGYEKGLAEHKPHSLKKIRQKEQLALKKILKEDQLSEIEDYRQNISSHSSKAHKPSSKSATSSSKKSYTYKTNNTNISKKPRLAIVLDDVAYGYQVKAIQTLHLPINLSFFPPSPAHPNTPLYAKSFRHYMIHLPLEAMHYSREEAVTLRSSTSLQAMDRYIEMLRRHFPRAQCINNHTGSKFTANYEAMRRLVKILDKYHFCFLDSRTTPNTAVPRLMHDLHRKYLARNIFLDNIQNVQKIKDQLKKAIRLAKRRGIAIAIGHPHPKTLQALRESKGVLKEVRLIYVDELLK